MRGLFITVEGMDGCGKTTQLNNIVQYLEDKGYNVISTREPGGTVPGEKIRELLLDTENKDMNSTSELLLYAAARAQLVSSVIVPALKEGKIVVCDRFVDSSIAYQGFGRGLGVEAVEEVNRWAVQGCIPDLTLFFDISPQEISFRKTKDEKGDRIETEAVEFHNRVYEGYLYKAGKDRDRIKVIDARKTVEEVFKETAFHLQAALELLVQREDGSI